jgi:hypothetical protein
MAAHADRLPAEHAILQVAIRVALMKDEVHGLDVGFLHR